MFTTATTTKLLTSFCRTGRCSSSAQKLSDSIGSIHHTRVPAIVTRTMTTTTTNNNNDNDDPLQIIKDATNKLNSFTSRLKNVSNKIQSAIVLPTTKQNVTMKDIVIHSRDADIDSFQKDIAKEARSIVLKISEEIENDLQDMSTEFSSTIQKQMEVATLICKDMPCGGSSYEILNNTSEEKKNETSDDGNIIKKVEIDGHETPCGKLHNASINFMKHSFETRFHISLGSRAAVLLRLAIKYNMPLSEIRKQGQQQSSSNDKDEDGGYEKRNDMNKVFQSERINLPWVRTEEEYKEYFRILKEQEEQ